MQNINKKQSCFHFFLQEQTLEKITTVVFLNIFSIFKFALLNMDLYIPVVLYNYFNFYSRPTDCEKQDTLHVVSGVFRQYNYIPPYFYY